MFSQKQLQTLLSNLDVRPRSEGELVLGASAVNVEPAVGHLRSDSDAGMGRHEAARQFVFTVRLIVKLAHEELNMARAQRHTSPSRRTDPRRRTRRSRNPDAGTTVLFKVIADLDQIP